MIAKIFNDRDINIINKNIDDIMKKAEINKKSNLTVL